MTEEANVNADLRDQEPGATEAKPAPDPVRVKAVAILEEARNKIACGEPMACHVLIRQAIEALKS